MIENAVVGRFSATETLDIGMDLGATVSAAYRDRAPFAFTGMIKDVNIELKQAQQ
jgi:arylsulfatase